MKVKILSALFVFLHLLIMTPHSVYCQEVEGIEIIDFGIYDAELTKTVQDNSHLSGIRVESKNFRLIEQTDRIPLKLGTRFGFRYKIVGRPNGDTVALTYEHTFPETSNPKTGEKSSRNVTALTKPIGAILYIGSRFDEAWELVPGEHKLTIFSHPSKIKFE